MHHINICRTFFNYGNCFVDDIIVRNMSTFIKSIHPSNLSFVSLPSSEDGEKCGLQKNLAISIKKDKKFTIPNIKKNYNVNLRRERYPKTIKKYKYNIHHRSN
jgi:hypothetical protein